MNFKKLKNSIKEDRVSSKVEFEDIPIQLQDMAAPGELIVEINENYCRTRSRWATTRSSLAMRFYMLLKCFAFLCDRCLRQQ